MRLSFSVPRKRDDRSSRSLPGSGQIKYDKDLCYRVQ